MKEVRLKCENVRINLSPVEDWNWNTQMEGDRFSGIDRLMDTSAAAHSRNDHSIGFYLLAGGNSTPDHLYDQDVKMGCGYLQMRYLSCGYHRLGPLGPVYCNDTLNRDPDTTTAGLNLINSLIDNNFTFTLLHR